MKNSKEVLRLICRVLIGIVFLYSGFVKGIDIVGTSYKLNEYFLGFDIPFLLPYSFILAIVLTITEFLLGICIILSVRIKSSSKILLVFMIFFTLLTLAIAILNNVSDCGCFGDSIKLTNWETFYKNIVLLIASIYIFFSRNAYKSFNSKNSIVILITSTIFFSSIMVYCYNNLPIVDFRPYKIGENIRTNRSFPIKSDKDIYEYYFIYTKNSQEKRFSINNLPDSTWTWKETNSQLIHKGSQPKILDFIITNNEEIDLTSEILNYDIVFLLISPDINKADEDSFKNISDLATACRKESIPFIGLTASNYTQINIFIQKHRIKYKFYNMDKKTLQTIIRSNPGVLLLNKGKIIDKWHYNNIPNLMKIKIKYKF